MSEYSQTRSFNLGIAQDTSVEAALIYDGFQYMSDNHTDENGWFYQSYDTLEKLLPYSRSTLRRAVELLIEKGFIEKEVVKVKGAPTCHYRISESVNLELSESVNLELSMDSVKLKLSSNSKTTNKTTNTASVSFGASEPPLAPPTKPDSTRVDGLLGGIIKIINPREKITDDRRKQLRARLKDYTHEEIIAAAKAFSKSQWHKDNGQMSIDNLIRASKFGRWYAAAEQEPDWKDVQRRSREEAAKALQEADENRV